MRNEGYYKLLGEVIKSAMIDYARLGKYIPGCTMTKQQQLDSADSFIGELEDILDGMSIPEGRKWAKHIKCKAEEMKKLGYDQDIMTIYGRKNEKTTD